MTIGLVAAAVVAVLHVEQQSLHIVLLTEGAVVVDAALEVGTVVSVGTACRGAEELLTVVLDVEDQLSILVTCRGYIITFCAVWSTWYQKSPSLGLDGAVSEMLPSRGSTSF